MLNLSAAITRGPGSLCGTASQLERTKRSGKWERLDGLARLLKSRTSRVELKYFAVSPVCLPDADVAAFIK